MLITFLSDHTYIPDRAGGRENSIHDLSLALMESGFKVVVVAKKTRKRTSLWKHLSTRLPYAVVRVNNPVEHAIETANRCGILIANLDNSNISSFAKRYRNRAFIFFRDTQALDLIPTDLDRNFSLLSNSKFSSETLLDVLGFKTFIFPPFVEPSAYSTTANGPYITFINPIAKKGLDIAKAAAQAMPSFKFQFVESWPLSTEAWQDLESFAAEAKNVKLTRKTTDMKRIYQSTRVLFVPSVWEEAWGRVVTEAHFSSIPAVVSDSGELTRVSSNGGIVISRSGSTAAWVEALRSAYEDGPVRDELVRGASLAANNYIQQSQRSFEDFVGILTECKDRFNDQRTVNLEAH